MNCLEPGTVWGLQQNNMCIINGREKLGTNLKLKIGNDDIFFRYHSAFFNNPQSWINKGRFGRSLKVAMFSTSFKMLMPSMMYPIAT